MRYFITLFIVLLSSVAYPADRATVCEANNWPSKITVTRITPDGHYQAMYTPCGQETCSTQAWIFVRIPGETIMTCSADPSSASIPGDTTVTLSMGAYYQGSGGWMVYEPMMGVRSYGTGLTNDFVVFTPEPRVISSDSFEDGIPDGWVVDY